MIVVSTNIVNLYRYIVRYDTGFAPNPYHEFCTIATCKPKIRKAAQPGDWIMGLGSAQAERDGQLVYAMRVSETLAFDEYWNDPRFAYKKPRQGSNYEGTCGDNVYRWHDEMGVWIQEKCFHCDDNLAEDTNADRVLIGAEFVYYGGAAIDLPVEFLARGEDYFCRFRNHQVHNLPTDLKNGVIEWLESLCRDGGRLGEPAEGREITGSEVVKPTVHC